MLSQKPDAFQPSSVIPQAPLWAAVAAGREPVTGRPAVDLVVGSGPKPSPRYGVNCPECGGWLVRTGGCFSCVTCGWGRCG